MDQWVRGIREKRSLLLDHGHPVAGKYPLWFLAEEAELVTDRLNRQTADRAVMLQMVISTIPNEVVKPKSTENVRRHFNKLIQSLTGA